MSDELEEIWKDIPGYPGYQVSSLGQVRSFWKRRILKKACAKYGTGTSVSIDMTTSPVLLTAFPTKAGHLRVPLRTAVQKSKCMHVHLAMMMAFVGPKPVGMQTRHLDGNPKNNVLSNLEYGTAKQNCYDKNLHGTDLKGSKHPMAKINEKTAWLVKFMLQMGVCNKECVYLFDLGKERISSINKGRSWAHVPWPLPEGP